MMKVHIHLLSRSWLEKLQVSKLHGTSVSNIAGSYDPPVNAGVCHPGFSAALSDGTQEKSARKRMALNIRL